MLIFLVVFKAQAPRVQAEGDVALEGSTEMEKILPWSAAGGVRVAEAGAEGAHASALGPCEFGCWC